MSPVLRKNLVFFLTDFAAAYPSVNHSWIFSVLENTGLTDFLCRFLRSIYKDSITHVECAGAKRGQFLVARGVRQGCPASGLSQCATVRLCLGARGTSSKSALAVLAQGPRAREIFLLFAKMLHDSWNGIRMFFVLCCCTCWLIGARRITNLW